MKKFFLFFAAALFCANMNAEQLNEGFEDEQFPPEGWTVFGGDSYSGWTKGVKAGSTCAKGYNYSTSVDSWIVTPQLRPASGEKLQFVVRVNEVSATGQLRIEYSVDGTDASSFTLLDTYYTSKTKGDEAHRIWTTDWQEIAIDLSAFVGQRVYFAFHLVGEVENLFLDNVKGVSLSGNAGCEAPSKLTVSNIEDNGATISWQGEAAEYEYLLIPAGEAVEWGYSERTTEKSITVNNLYADEAYEFYVRSYCSETQQSLAAKVAFRTICGRYPIPFIETFTRDETGHDFVVVTPDCWTIASENPQVCVVRDKTYDDEGTAQAVYSQAHLTARGGGANSVQVFAMPAMDARLDTLEVAFDYYTNMVSADYGRLEVGYMTNPSKAATFVNIKTLPQTLSYTHAVVSLEDVPADAMFIAFRYAGGTSEFGLVAMDNFIVAGIGKSASVDPADEDLADAGIWSQSYCEAGFTWYAYTSSAFAIGLFEVESQQLVNGITVTTSECDRFAYQDGVSFSEDDDYENHYYCSTKWILNVENPVMGPAWTNSVINVGTTVTPQLGLKPGSYQVQVYDLVQVEDGYQKGALLATIPFTLVEKKIENLQAVVAEDHQTATLTWDEPALAVGERVYVSVRSGETVVYDNFEVKSKAVSPLVVNVEESRTYDAYFQILDKKGNPLGAEVTANFTVGVNPYEPANAKAEVFGGDNVTFSWTATTEADAYEIMLYLNGEFYTTLTVHGTTKTTTMPADGTWSWTVQAFTKGANGNYFPASNAVAGNDFVSKGAEIPEDAVELNVADFNAFYIDQDSRYYQEGKNGWVLIFRTGEEGYPGYPIAWFLVYTNYERALSGVYNTSRGNIDLESCLLVPSSDAREDQYILGTDAEIRLQFDGYDEEKYEQGYVLAYYTGSFRLVGNDGKTYIAKFMEMLCYSGNFDDYLAGNASYEGMFDEETTQGIEQVIATGENGKKFIMDGQLYILRDGKVYNATGVQVK